MPGDVQARGDRREAVAGGRAGFSWLAGRGGGSLDRRDAVHVLPLAAGVRRAQVRLGVVEIHFEFRKVRHLERQEDSLVGDIRGAARAIGEWLPASTSPPQPEAEG